MKLAIHSTDGSVIWERQVDNGLASGYTNKGYASDGMLKQIVETLDDALEEAKAELRVFDKSDVVRDVGTSAT